MVNQNVLDERATPITTHTHTHTHTHNNLLTQTTNSVNKTKTTNDAVGGDDQKHTNNDRFRNDIQEGLIIARGKENGRGGNEYLEPCVGLRQIKNILRIK